jgi:ppGpp synthetase/RelA/SpoT-type nucleotidyltranferase
MKANSPKSAPRKPGRTATVQGAKIDLHSFDKFCAHPLTAKLAAQYETDAVLAKAGVATLVNDLEAINDEYRDKYDRVAFTTLEGRVKKRDSFLRKLYANCRGISGTKGITSQTLKQQYQEIRDICGVRFSCPYYDEVEVAINTLIRGELSRFGHATDLRNEPGLADKNYLDQGDEFGYRSYHLFVRVSTLVDIYGNTQSCLCEVQGRSELQHIWAVKSHYLLYKPRSGWELGDKHVVDDMRQVSQNLRAVDQFLLSIRDRSTKPKL